MNEMGEGWINLGLGVMYSRRYQMHEGADRVMNMENARTSSRIYTLDASAGIWKRLSFRLTFPILDVTATDDENGTVHELTIGDMPLVLSYLFQSEALPPTWRLSLGAGAYVPTGSSIESDVPSNPNFVSGTVDPIATVNGGYDFKPHFGLFTHAFTRLVVYQNEEDYRASNSVTYGGGARVRYSGSFTFALGVNALHRFKDERDGVDVETSGGDWIYVAPTLSYLFMKGALSGFSVILSAQIPVYQRLNGMQLAESFNASLSLGYGLQMWGGGS